MENNLREAFQILCVLETARTLVSRRARSLHVRKREILESKKPAPPQFPKLTSSAGLRLFGAIGLGSGAALGACGFFTLMGDGGGFEAFLVLAVSVIMGFGAFMMWDEYKEAKEKEYKAQWEYDKAVKEYPSVLKQWEEEQASIPRLERLYKDADREEQKIEYYLKKYYDAFAVPSQYRNHHATWYVNKWVSTSRYDNLVQLYRMFEEDHSSHDEVDMKRCRSMLKKFMESDQTELGEMLRGLKNL